MSGSLLRRATWTGPVAGNVRAEYDQDFRDSQLDLNGVPLAVFGYDQDGLLVTAGDLLLWRSALNGRLDSTTLGGITTREAYDTFGQWSRRTASAGGTALYDVGYVRDPVGRITQLTEVIQSDTTVPWRSTGPGCRRTSCQSHQPSTTSPPISHGKCRVSLSRTRPAECPMIKKGCGRCLAGVRRVCRTHARGKRFSQRWLHWFPSMLLRGRL